MAALARGAGAVKQVQGVQEALGALPRSYVLVLRGALAGFSEEELAALADVPRESIRPMVQLAAAKLVSALTEHGERDA